MRLRVASVFAGWLTLISAVPATAQLRASRPPAQPKNLPRLLIANPHTFAAADSAAAVRVGTGMREKMESVADKWYTVIQRNQMNDALQQYGYPIDAVLPPLVARQLGSQLQARAIVVGTFARGEGGRIAIEARLLSGNDQTGHMVSMTQIAGQTPEDLGGKVAEALRGPFNALPDAKQCNDLQTTQPAKAVEAGAKAIKVQPNHGPAEFCLAMIAVTKKAPADEIIGHFKNAAAGDRLSVEALGGLLGQYQEKKDTANIIETYRKLIVVAPNNQKVVEEAARFFIAASKPDLGEEIARDAIARDPSNPDNYNLLSIACLVQDKPEKNKCAIDAIEQMFTLDSTRADTLNLQKMIYVASRDSVNAPLFLKWVQFAVRKQPGNPIFMSELGKAYELTGPTDSVVAVARRLVEMDKTDLTPVVRAVRSLLREKRYQEALALGALIEQHGQDADKTNLGLLLANEGGLPVLQTQPVDFALATELGKKASSLLKPGSRGHVLASYVLGFGLLGQVTSKDQEAMTSKSCESVNALETWVNDTKAALTIGQAISATAGADVQQRIQTLETGYATRLPQMRKAYCKAK